MISVKVDRQQLDSIIREELQKKLKQLEHRHTFWDLKELSRQTNMSEPFIKEHFFYNERFPKFRVGRKWLMPARETEEFLLGWLNEQPKN